MNVINMNLTMPWLIDQENADYDNNYFDNGEEDGDGDEGGGGDEATYDW